MGVDEVVDLEDGNMQCRNHPYKNNINPGGICAFCLQEKLGNLVSSSFPIAVFPSSSTSSDSSFRSDAAAAPAPDAAASSSSIRLHHQSIRNVDVNDQKTTATTNIINDSHFNYYSSRRARIPSFLLTQRINKKNLKTSTSLPLPSRSSVVYNRSKSTTTPGRGVNRPNDADSPRRRGFWSFLYHSKQTTNKKTDINPSNEISPAPMVSNPRENFIVVEENDESPDLTPFDRKVSRSRSVGCGSRSFSGDFFERLSTGFGDCTLRRVESQREGKVKSRTSGQDCIKERVKCGGIFSGFMLAATSSSSSSNSYWVSSSSSSTESNGNVRGKVGGTGMGHHHHHHHNQHHHNQQQQQLAHGRSRSWGWAFASPMRALGKPYSSSALYPSIKRSEPTSTTSNLNATTVPSLLAVRG